MTLFPNLSKWPCYHINLFTTYCLLNDYHETLSLTGDLKFFAAHIKTTGLLSLLYKGNGGQSTLTGLKTIFVLCQIRNCEISNTFTRRYTFFQGFKTANPMPMQPCQRCIALLLGQLSHQYDVWQVNKTKLTAR